MHVNKEEKYQKEMMATSVLKVAFQDSIYFSCFCEIQCIILRIFYTTMSPASNLQNLEQINDPIGQPFFEKLGSYAEK